MEAGDESMVQLRSFMKELRDALDTSNPG